MKTNISLSEFLVKQYVFISNKELFLRRKIMKIILDEVKKDGVLVKNDGTEVSRYSYKNVLNENLTIEDLKKDIEGFNVTLGQQEEFDDIKVMSNYLKIHNW